MGRKKAKRCSSIHLPSIPQDLIDTLILPRLPIKSLFRSKLVAKHWNSLISSHSFAKDLLDQHEANPNSTSVVLKAFSEGYSELTRIKVHHKGVDVEYKVEQSRFDLGYITSTINVIGSCNGLLCLRLVNDSMRHCFLIWNPITHERRIFKGPNVPLSADLLCAGFGYDFLSDDYKIVVIQVNYRSLMHRFSLRKKRWKRLFADSTDWQLLIERQPVNVNQAVLVGDTLNWLLSWGDKHFLVAFDLSKESFSSLSLPENVHNLEFICEIRRCLCLCHVLWTPGIGFTELKVCILDGKSRLHDPAWKELFCARNLENYAGGSSIWPNLVELQDDTRKVFALTYCCRTLILDTSTDAPCQITPLSLNRNRSSISSAYKYTESIISPFSCVGAPRSAREYPRLRYS